MTNKQKFWQQQPVNDNSSNTSDPLQEIQLLKQEYALEIEKYKKRHDVLMHFISNYKKELRKQTNNTTLRRALAKKINLARDGLKDNAKLIEDRDALLGQLGNLENSLQNTI